MKDHLKFTVECDGSDALVLLDKGFIGEMNEELLYSMEYLLDYKGETELIYDFPNEAWTVVRNRESKLIKSYCNSGKMIINLFKDGDHECEFEILDNIQDTSSCLYLPTGNLLAVNASELIQCVLYPEIEMEELFELNIEAGGYGISAYDSKYIFSLKLIQKPPFNNVNE